MSDLKTYIQNLRHDFAKQILDEKDVNKNPVLQFEKWFKEAVDAKVNEPNAMTLATVDEQNKPSARIVLLRNFDETGMVFYTNYKSRKGVEMEVHKNCALLFFWSELERQVRIEGTLTKQTDQESDFYFFSRPRESKIGAWVSEQSKVITDRNYLDERYKIFSEKYPTDDVPRPPQWGGYIVKPVSFEFWQGRPSRLHDRVHYSLENGNWKITRLAP